MKSIKGYSLKRQRKKRVRGDKKSAYATSNNSSLVRRAEYRPWPSANALRALHQSCGPLGAMAVGIQDKRRGALKDMKEIKTYKNMERNN
jgi:hypothetical protein